MGLIALGFQIGFIVRYVALTIGGKIQVRVGIDVTIVATAQAILLGLSDITLALQSVRIVQPWRTAMLAFLYTVLCIWMHRVFVDIGIRYRVQATSNIR